MDYIEDNNMSYGVIAQEIAELFPEMFITNNPIPDPVLTVSAPPQNNIIFNAGQAEMLKVTEDGFYVRGVKVEADEDEASAVYKAFKAFLIHHALTKEY
jgi:hypothetical protein